MTQSAAEEERDKLIVEWMRSNDSFKKLARKFGKGGKPSAIAQRMDEEEDRIKVDQDLNVGAEKKGVAVCKPLTFSVEKHEGQKCH